NLKIEKQSYLTYMQQGGLPELSNLPDEEMQRNYVMAVKNTVLLRDIIQRHVIKDAQLLEDIFKYFIVHTSQLISIRNIVNFFISNNRKTNYETVSTYIQYIEQAFLIYKTERYLLQGKQTIAGVYKYYCNDASFKNYLYPGLHHGVGYMLENLVFLELLRFGYQVYIGNIKHKEIDFVAHKKDRIIYIQVSYILENQETIEREYSVLELIQDNYEKYVVSLDDILFPPYKGIRHCNVWKLHELL
ncbi:MAG: ATP-binding protein, partial [Bacteroidota bacterium]